MSMTNLLRRIPRREYRPGLFLAGMGAKAGATGTITVDVID